MKKVENFEAALENLKEIFECTEPYGNIEITGMVGLFEICFEQAWKAMKEVLSENGFAESQTGSPRMILKTAFQAGLIHDEALWLDALVSRNNVAHAYNRDIALDIVRRTKSDYYALFEKLRDTIEKDWKISCKKTGL